ncbi:hypothetical protein Tco_0179711 [Tanacetum coccineum]
MPYLLRRLSRLRLTSQRHHPNNQVCKLPYYTYSTHHHQLSTWSQPTAIRFISLPTTVETYPPILSQLPYASTTNLASPTYTTISYRYIGTTTTLTQPERRRGRAATQRSISTFASTLDTDHRADIPEVTLLPRKRLGIALGLRYEVRESSYSPTARPPRGFRADYGFVATIDREIRQDLERYVGYGITDTWEEMLACTCSYNSTDGRELGVCSKAWDIHDASELARRSYVTARQAQFIEALKLLKRLQTQMIEFKSQQGPSKGSAQPDAPEEAREMIDQGVTAALAARDADKNTNGDDSHNSGMGVRRTERTAHECTYTDFLKCQPLNFKGTNDVEDVSRRSDKTYGDKNYVGGLPPGMIHRSVVALNQRTIQEALKSHNRAKTIENSKESIATTRIDDLYDPPQGSNVYSRIDLRSGYHLASSNGKDIPQNGLCDGRTRYGVHYEFQTTPRVRRQVSREHEEGRRRLKPWSELLIDTKESDSVRADAMVTGAGAARDLRRLHSRGAASGVGGVSMASAYNNEPAHASYLSSNFTCYASCAVRIIMKTDDHQRILRAQAVVPSIGPEQTMKA